MTSRSEARSLAPVLVVTLAVAILATVAVLCLLRWPSTGVDDANIFFVYARNVAGGHGFVFNVGGERVEGFTSLLWVLICAAAFGLSRNPERALLFLSVLMVALTAACCVRSPVFRREPGRADLSVPWATVFLVLLFSDGRYVTWNTATLMDTSMWGCLLTLSVVLVLGDAPAKRLGWSLAGMAVLLILARPEALLWVPLIVMVASVKQSSTTGKAGAIQVIGPAVVASLLTVGLLTAARLWYFGFPLPNTFYAKVSPSAAFVVSEGTKYLRDYVLSGPIPLLSSIAVVMSALRLGRAGLNEPRTFALVMFAAAGLMLPVLIGGDHFRGFRFYQSVYPILLLALVHVLRFVVLQDVTLPASARTRRAGVLAGSSLLAAAFIIVQALEWTAFEERVGLSLEFQIAEQGRALGRRADRLFAALPRRPGIGTITVGGLQYAYGGDVVDLMGLNNTRMAHNGGDRIGIKSHAAFEKRTFYELRPPVLVPLIQNSQDLASLETRSMFADLALKGLLQEPEFRRLYRLADVTARTPGGDVSLAAWYEKGWLVSLEQSAGFQIVASQKEH